MACVVRDFVGENEHEMTLCVDEHVEVLSEEACGWWFGRIKNADDESGPSQRHGWFPGSFVRPHAPMPTRAPPR